MKHVQDAGAGTQHPQTSVIKVLGGANFSKQTLCFCGKGNARFLIRPGDVVV